jgi:hypothetical protein
MADDILPRLQAQLPELFAAAVARLEQRAANGDKAAAQRLASAGDAPVPSLLRIAGDGGGELWFGAGRGGLQLRAAPAAPASEFGHALELEVAAARYALLLAERTPGEVEEVVSALALIASATAREALATVSFCFSIEVLRVPVVGTLRVRVGFGRPVLAARPEFALTVDADELEDAREQGLGPHQLFLAGKVKIDGDAAKAMQLAMVLAQLR